MENPIRETKKYSKKELIYLIIFEADTFWGKIFDVSLLIVILLSVLAVSLESVKFINDDYGHLLRILEWVFTILFTFEYLARIYAIKKKWGYILSLYGIIDLLAIIPTYLSLVVAGSQTLVVIRSLRLLRIFRILKLARYLDAAANLKAAMQASKRKIFVFLGVVFILVIIMGTLMYIIEGAENGFTSIPRSIYWAVVTLTTVGYGDISPQTVLGQLVAMCIMIMGYGIIAVPTGIVSAEIASKKSRGKITTHICPSCTKEGHDFDATNCKYCGSSLDPDPFS